MNQSNLFQVKHREIYGRDLYYPISDNAVIMASLMKVKTFTLKQLRELSKMEIFTFKTDYPGNF